MTDMALERATALVSAALDDASQQLRIAAFFDEATNTVSYVVSDKETGRAAVIASALDYDAASGRTDERSAQAILAYVAANRLAVNWLIETHAQADHLSAAPYLQEKFGGKLAIGRGNIRVQDVFGKIFNEGTAIERETRLFMCHDYKAPGRSEYAWEATVGARLQYPCQGWHR